MFTRAEMEKLDNKEYRDYYADTLVKSALAYQIRAIRKSRNMTQKSFATLVGKPQSVISRLENTEYGQLTLQTLLDIARRLDIFVIAAFASFPEFMQRYRDLSPQRLAVRDYAATRHAAPAPTRVAVSGAATTRQVALGRGAVTPFYFVPQPCDQKKVLEHA